jgi:glycosyltransferase involved in cell wall biosynthesis
MRIAYLSGAYIPSSGANSIHVMGMCQAMAQLGHDVTLYARPGNLDAKDDFHFYGVEPVFKISKQARPQLRIWGAAMNAWRNRRALERDGKPDLIYARETWALTLASGIGAPFIFESHWHPGRLFHRTAERRLLRHPLLERVVFISEALRKIYLEEFPWLQPQLTVVAHDAANVVPPQLDTQTIKPGRESGLQVGYLGSFQTGCGLELIEEIAPVCPTEDFHVFGGDPSEVDRWSQRTSHIQNLHFHGFVPPIALPNVYRALEVVLAPYQHNTRSIGWASPMKLFEYMAHGKPIVCSDFPVLREVIEGGVTGVLVESDDAEAWAGAIRLLRDDPGLRSSIGKAAEEMFRCRFTWRQRASRVLDGVC